MDHRHHQHQLDILTDALMSGEEKYVADCLQKLDRLEGEPYELMISLLAGGSEPPKEYFPKRLKFSRWKADGDLKPSAAAHSIDDGIPWASGSEKQVVKSLSERSFLTGNALITLAGLIRPDMSLKASFPKRIKFAGRGRGKPPVDLSLRRAEETNIVGAIRRLLKKNNYQLEAAISEVGERFDLSRATLFRIWGDWDGSKGPFI